MNKKRFFLLCCMLLLVFCAVLWKADISNRFTQSWLRVAKQQVRHCSSVGFSYAGIDSLYAVNGYRYFLFVKNEEGIPFVMKEQADSVLLVLSKTFSAPFDKHPADQIFVPTSAFDFLLDESDAFQMYRVTGVEKRGNGNLYRLAK